MKSKLKKTKKNIGIGKKSSTGVVKKTSLFDRVQQLKKKKAKKNIIIKK